MQRGKARREDDKREKVRKTRTLEPGSLDTGCVGSEVYAPLPQGQSKETD